MRGVFLCGTVGHIVDAELSRAVAASMSAWGGADLKALCPPRSPTSGCHLHERQMRRRPRS